MKGITFDTNSGILPYKIMYLLTGALAILVGISVLLWMPDSPVHARFLTEKERIVAVERIRNDQGGTENKTFKKEQIWETLLDIRTWLMVLSVLVSGSPTFVIVLFVDLTNSTASIPNGSLSNCMLKQSRYFIADYLCLVSCIVGNIIIKVRDIQKQFNKDDAHHSYAITELWI